MTAAECSCGRSAYRERARVALGDSERVAERHSGSAAAPGWVAQHSGRDGLAVGLCSDGRKKLYKRINQLTHKYTVTDFYPSHLRVEVSSQPTVTECI